MCQKETLIMIETENLDLYAKIEPLIGFEEAYEALYQIYLELLNPYDVQSVLDIGCGNGNFLLQLRERYETLGIDLSPRMVEIARKKGLHVRNQQISKLEGHFDAVVAVGDVLNYLRIDELKAFLLDVERILHQGGIFICDVNTLHGFEEVTAGSMSADFGNQFLSIDAEFLDGILTTEITLFEEIGNCYKKEQDTILQFYHDKESIIDLAPLRCIKMQDLGMFSEDDDKTIFIFQKG